MTDAQALSRWIAREVARIKADPAPKFQEARYLNAIRHLSSIDAIMLLALSMIAGVDPPDLDKIKDDPARRRHPGASPSIT
jgi:hypothetical protein